MTDCGETTHFPDGWAPASRAAEFRLADLERRFGGLIGHCPANAPALAWRIRYRPKPGGAVNEIYQGPSRLAALRKCAELEERGARVLKASTGERWPGDSLVAPLADRAP